MKFTITIGFHENGKKSNYTKKEIYRKFFLEYEKKRTFFIRIESLILDGFFFVVFRN